MSDTLVDYYYKIKSKKQIKISIICDSNNVPLSHIITNPKKHDSQMVVLLIKKLDIKLNNNATIIGDCGYLLKKKRYRDKHNNKIRLLVPVKKNQNKKISRIDKIKLKKRFIVEQTFSHLKKSYRRLTNIYDRKINNYETFLIMAICCQIIKSLNEKQIEKVKYAIENI